MTKSRKRKKSAAPVITAVVLLIAAAAAVFFGYDFFLKYTHPIKYEEYVEKYARENRLDKYLVYAVIKTESGFDKNAVSDVGARGLMQIMEETFDWISYRMGDENTEYLGMFDPETNIRYGCWLLGYLCDEFGNAETAMAAYHAGRGRVNEWLNDRSISSDGVHLDKIPIPDTRHYVGKITNTMKIYKKLYEGK